MIPLADHNARRSMPIVTYLIIALNIAAFAYELSLGDTLARFIEMYGAVPVEITTGHGIPSGAPNPIYVTLLTSLFLHGGVLHIAGNMLYFWVFGDNVEDAMGHLGFLMFYLIVGLCASGAQIFIDPRSSVPSIGASGAIAGVLAAYLILYPRQPIRTLVFFGFVWIANVSAFILIGFWFVAQFFHGFTSIVPGVRTAQNAGIAYWAHIGGFAAGLILVRLFASRPRPTIYGGY